MLKVFENTQRKGKKYKVNIDEIELEKGSLYHCDYNEIINNNIIDYQCFKLIELKSFI